MTRILLPFLATAAMMTLPASPATAADAPPPADAVRTVTVFGNDACPPSSPNEIVVCARRPESERYRIPKALRQKKPRDSDGAWGNTALMLDEVGRQQMVPGSCSVNGNNGQSGCRMQAEQQWYADRKQRKAEQAQIDEQAQAAAADIPPQQ